jgi:biotin carboxyl carrier protein
LKFLVEIDGENHSLDSAALESASIEEVMPGVFSLLLGTRSFTVYLAAQGDRFEAVSSDSLPRLVSVADTRDRRASADASSTKGPALIRAQMPGKIIKVLVEIGATVEAGQGLIVAEAMKMQNEVKAPKNGMVARILVAAGATVSAGETLMVLE